MTNGCSCHRKKYLFLFLPFFFCLGYGRCTSTVCETELDAQMEVVDVSEGGLVDGQAATFDG